jgi:hypothetical protein
MLKSLIYLFHIQINKMYFSGNKNEVANYVLPRSLKNKKCSLIW